MTGDGPRVSGGTGRSFLNDGESEGRVGVRGRGWDQTCRGLGRAFDVSTLWSTVTPTRVFRTGRGGGRTSPVRTRPPNSPYPFPSLPDRPTTQVRGVETGPTEHILVPDRAQVSSVP